MGLKGAGSYFQRMMVTEVLSGLIHDICESYLDDIMCTGANEAEFLANLRRVFERFRAFNITLNPAKCRFGLAEVEYVGRVINKEGLTFTRSKLDSVVNFPLPRTQKDLKSFLGLVNFFREHIMHHSTMVAAMNALTTQYRPGKMVIL